MSKNQFNNEAAKAAIDNANEVVALTLKNSVALIEKNVAATKATLERQAAYTAKVSNVRNFEDLPDLQKEYAAQELQAIEKLSQELYAFGNEATSNLASISERNRSAAEEAVAESLEQAANAIPNGSSQPYGSFFKDVVRNQIDAYKQFNSFVEDVASKQRDNLNAVAQAMGDLGQIGKGTTAKKGKK